jgi:hypothetical protein
VSNIVFYDPKSRVVIKVGESRIVSKSKRCIDSIHAEELAIRYIMKFHPDKKKRLKIIIWKKNGSAFCCRWCKKIIEKYNFNPNNVITPVVINNDFNYISAVQDCCCPVVMKH